VSPTPALGTAPSLSPLYGIAAQTIPLIIVALVFQSRFVARQIRRGVWPELRRIQLGDRALRRRTEDCRRRIAQIHGKRGRRIPPAALERWIETRTTGDAAPLAVGA
jgi:hypothetical protein